jgi:hypothetical protein
MDTITPPGIGHNQGPGILELERAAELVANANRWVTERPEITDADMAGTAQGFVDQLRAASKELETARRAEKKPLEDQVKAIDDKYRDPAALLKLALDKLLRLSSAWLAKEKARKDEEARKVREEADRKRREAEEAAAKAAEEAKKKGGNALEAELAATRAQEEAEAARKLAEKKPERAQVKGDYSARAMTLRTYWHAKLAVERPAGNAGADAFKAFEVNRALVLKHYAKSPAARDAMIEACLRIAGDEARKAKSAEAAPPGLVFFKEEKAS